MHRTKERKTSYPLLIGSEELAAKLSCGTATAKKIAELAEARVVIGRRVLYCVDKIATYLKATAM